MQKLEFIYKLGSQKITQIWGKLEPILKNQGKLDNLSLYGKRVKGAKISTELKKQKRKSFNIEADNFVFHMSTVTNYNHIFVQIENKESDEAQWWSDWVNELVTLNGFVQAWLADSEYDYWQNAKDPIEYESNGRSYEGLSMVSNGLPAPLEQLEVDTSKNLGLRKLCDGYVEIIGSNMWLSKKFLSLVNKDIKEIIKNSQSTIESIDGGILHLSSTADIFKDSTTESEQKMLREALFS